MTKHIIENQDIIVWKGVKWAKLLKFDKYNFSRLFIQVATLSRYTHTAIYLKYRDAEYLLQSNLIDGMHILDVTGQTWFRSNIDENVYDHLRCRYTKNNAFQDQIKDIIFNMYKQNTKKVKFGTYNKLGIVNQFLVQFLSKSFISKTKLDKMFCSELTHYYFTNSNDSYKLSPQDVVDNDLYKKVK
jgi:hypothetical protein